MSVVHDPSLLVVTDAEATAAAHAAGVEVRPVGGHRELRRVSELLAEVWRVPLDRSPGPVNILTAIADTGGYVAGAYRGSELVGASFGLTYLDGAVAAGGEACLRSQVTGAVERGTGIGAALKLDQRAWAARRGLARITWTFDPLVRANARFNLGRLGARIVRHVPDFYGDLDDGVNGRSPTDRCVVSWSTVPEDRSGRVGDDLGVDVPADASAVVVLDVVDGVPQVEASDAAVRLVATPDDIVLLRTVDPDLALRWTDAMSRAIGAALADGLEGRSISDTGWYRFCRPSRPAARD
ncbi:unannotated protein [freshwater metagenome]|uniref:Unannotated protein n=1 Tax=freshwater metagenome TaxID=449393 RepID=A0A6J6EZD6_9ZZZZ